jgi:DNA-binding transcriptional ArsR family regulator
MDNSLPRESREVGKGFDSGRPEFACVYFTDPLINDQVNHVTSDALTTTFAALADPTRRAILARLAVGETTVNELAAPFDISLPAISRHLKVLERAGLISRTARAQWRPCRLEPVALRAVAAWLDEYRRLWEHSLDRLDDYLRELQSVPPPVPRRRRGPTRKKR